MENEGKMAYKNCWDHPFSDRVWHECGACRGIVSKKAKVCRHHGATFIGAYFGYSRPRKEELAERKVRDCEI